MNSSLAVAAFGSQQRGSLWAGPALAGAAEGMRQRQELHGRQQEGTQLYLQTLFMLYMTKGG